MWPAEHHFPGSWHRGVLHPGVERSPGNQQELADNLAPTLASCPCPPNPAGLSHQHLEQLLAAEGHRSCLITALHAETLTEFFSAHCEFNVQSCLFSQVHPFYSPAF